MAINLPVFPGLFHNLIEAIMPKGEISHSSLNVLSHFSFVSSLATELHQEAVFFNVCDIKYHLKTVSWSDLELLKPVELGFKPRSTSDK